MKKSQVTKWSHFRIKLHMYLGRKEKPVGEKKKKEQTLVSSPGEWVSGDRWERSNMIIMSCGAQLTEHSFHWQRNILNKKLLLSYIVLYVFVSSLVKRGKAGWWDPRSGSSLTMRWGFCLAESPLVAGRHSPQCPHRSVSSSMAMSDLQAEEAVNCSSFQLFSSVKSS